MACDIFQRERCVAAEMEACWEPINSTGASLPGYDPQNDPFCPLAVARRFNQMQREASIGGTQSMIDLRQPSRSFRKNSTTSLQRSSQRPRSSGGRITATLSPLIGNNGGTCRPGAGEGQMALPCVAGASLQLREGGGFTAIRQPPLRASKGLPSFSQVNKGLARRKAKERQLASKTTTRTSLTRGRGTARIEEGRGPAAAAELSGGARKEFTFRVARRDDVLQDVWLKMHSAEGFATVEGSVELARLLKLYRSASLELIEDMMRHPDLEEVADAYTRKKGEGMRSFREAVSQDADFADGIPEAASWLRFSARRNPLFLPPKLTGANDKPLADIGIEGDNGSDILSRLRDAQAFILLEKTGARADRGGEVGGANEEVVGSAAAAGDSAANVSVRKSLQPDGDGRGGPRKSRVRGRVRVLNTQLAGAQETIRDLEETLRLLEAERDTDGKRAARVREAAAEAGRRKMTQRMFRLRGDAAVLEEGIEEMERDITAFRVRLFAERLDVARKRMLKDALSAEMSTKARTRPRRGKKLNPPKVICPEANNLISAKEIGVDKDNDNDSAVDYDRQKQRDKSAATIQARVRGMGARRSKEGARENSSSNTRVQAITHRCTGIGHEEEEAAVRIEAAVRGRLARKRLLEGAENSASRSASLVVASSNDTVTAETKEGSRKISSTGPSAAATSQPAVSPLPWRPLPSPYFLDGLTQLEALGVVGVRAFFDSLGLGAYADRLRRQRPSTDSVESVDGAELARICRAANPDAALRAAGMSARLHRVKLLSALGLGVDLTAASGLVPGAAARTVLASSSPSALDGNGATCTPGGGSAAFAPVATIAALHMVRQLRRELLPRGPGRGSGVGGENGFKGTARVVGTSTAMPGEGASLFPVLLPELEMVLFAQAELQSQHGRRQCRAAGVCRNSEHNDGEIAGPATSSARKFAEAVETME